MIVVDIANEINGFAAKAENVEKHIPCCIFVSLIKRSLHYQRFLFAFLFYDFSKT